MTSLDVRKIANTLARRSSTRRCPPKQMKEPGNPSRRALVAAMVGCAALPLTSRASTISVMQTIDKSPYDAFTVMAPDARFSTSVGLLQQSGLAPEARGATPYTVFAPTNAAFRKYPTYLQSLLPGSAQAFPDAIRLVDYIRMHAVVGLHPLSEFVDRQVRLVSASGVPIVVGGANVRNPIVTYHLPDGQLASAHLLPDAILCSNALIYPIDDRECHGNGR